MKIMPVNVAVVKKTIPQSAGTVANNKSKKEVGFRGFASRVSALANNEIHNSTWTYNFKHNFVPLIKEAASEATSKHMGLINRLTDPAYPIGEKLKYIKENYKNAHIEIASVRGKELVAIEDGAVKFSGDKNSVLNVQDYVTYSLDSDLDYKMETPFTLVRAYRNGNLKEVTIYNSDYSGSESTYYNKDGSENILKNFFSSFL